MNEALVASVIICTYNRPNLFKISLKSCLQDATRKALNFEIIVADNSIEGHASAIVDSLAPLHIPVRVIRVSPPNIALARNAGVLAAAAPLIAFMDDDLELVSGWLDALVDTLETTQSDVAVGPLRPRFPGNRPPEWDVDGERFTRVLDRATGSLIAASGPDKPPGFALSTASSLWRRATCFTDATPFDPTFGASGGEDFDLFLRLDRRGRRFVWCAEGGVIETVPPNRMDIGYQRLKAYSAGTVYAAVSINNASSKLLAALDIGIRGFIQAIMFGTAGAVLTALSQFGVAGLQTRAASLIFAALTGWGKVTWWRRVALYHVEKSPS